MGETITIYIVWLIVYELVKELRMNRLKEDRRDDVICRVLASKVWRGREPVPLLAA